MINTQREILDNKDKTYCYRFTWLGPAFNNETNLGNTDITCSDLIATNNQNPCRQPFLITCKCVKFGLLSLTESVIS